MQQDDKGNQALARWQFTKKFLEQETPSRKDSIAVKKEASLRRLALAFCQDVGFLLKMNQYTIATAFVYWQRFFTIQSLAKNDPYLIAAACLLLAGKVEENFKSLQKITETAYFVRNKKDPKASEALRANQKLLVAEMDRVVKAEEVLLVAMNFDFFVSHPYRPLLGMVKDLGYNRPDPDGVNTKFCQIAWNFANDSFRTTLCLQALRPADIAAACINLAATTLQRKLPPTAEGKNWFTKYDVDANLLHEVELQIMSLYKKKDGDSKTSPTSRASLPQTPTPPAPTRDAHGTPSPTSPMGSIPAIGHSTPPSAAPPGAAISNVAMELTGPAGSASLDSWAAQGRGPSCYHPGNSGTPHPLVLAAGQSQEVKPPPPGSTLPVSAPVLPERRGPSVCEPRSTVAGTKEVNKVVHDQRTMYGRALCSMVHDGENKRR